MYQTSNTWSDMLCSILRVTTLSHRVVFQEAPSRHFMEVCNERLQTNKYKIMEKVISYMAI